MTVKAQKDLETKLLSDPKTISLGEQLLAASTDAEGIFFNELGIPQRSTMESVTLDGEKALAYLGLKPRPYLILHADDEKKITKRFQSFIEECINRGNDGGADELFWKNIKIRVWKKSNVSKFCGGLQLGPSSKNPNMKAIDVPPAQYAGYILNGTSLQGFVPNRLPNHKTQTHRFNEFITQLVSVTVTEEMAAHVPIIYH